MWWLGTWHELNHIQSYMHAANVWQIPDYSRHKAHIKGPFNTDTLRVSVPLLLLLQALRGSLLPLSPLQSTVLMDSSCILQGIINPFTTPKPKSRVRVNEEGHIKSLHKISGFCGTAWYFRLLLAADSLSLKHLGSKVLPKRSMPLSVKVSLNGKLR